MSCERCQWIDMASQCHQSCRPFRPSTWRYGRYLFALDSMAVFEFQELLSFYLWTCYFHHLGVAKAFVPESGRLRRVCNTKLVVRYCSQEYVKARLLQFVGEPVFAKRMYQTVEGVQRAAKEVLTELSVPANNSLQDGVSGAYSLQFRHECRSAYKLACFATVIISRTAHTTVDSTAFWLQLRLKSGSFFSRGPSR